MLNSAFKCDLDLEDLFANLIRSIALLIKVTFNKTIGIEPIMIKGFVNVLTKFLKNYSPKESATGEKIVQHTIKTVGIFFSLAALIPNKMSSIYKQMLDNNILQSVIELINTDQRDVRDEAIQVLSVAIHPFFGEVYTMPWKRGPHQAISEYNECQPIFDSIRTISLSTLDKFNWIEVITEVYKNCNNLITQISILRMILQFIRV